MRRSRDLYTYRHVGTPKPNDKNTSISCNLYIRLDGQVKKLVRLHAYQNDRPWVCLTSQSVESTFKRPKALVTLCQVSIPESLRVGRSLATDLAHADRYIIILSPSFSRSSICMHPGSHTQLANNYLCTFMFCLFFISFGM